jgi:hypothetical protein
VGIAKDAKKTSNYYGTYMRVLQMMPKKNQWLLWRLYAGIATNEECARLFMPYMRVLQGMQNASGYYGTHMWVLQRM